MAREIVVNGRFLSRRVTGVERYGREILSLIGDRCRVEKTRLNGFPGHAWEQFIVPAKIKSNSILWSPANTGPLLVRNQALTIHDLSPLEHPEWFNPTFAAWYRFLLPNLAKRVRVIFTPSEYVRQKLEERFGTKNIVVTPNGVDMSVFYRDARQTHFDLPEKYILFVGSIQPRKNLAGLMHAWREIKEMYKDTWLIVAGGTENVFRADNFSKEQRVRFLGYVSDDDLPGLYARARLFILPSLDEGSALPVLEAMACGTPIIASDGGALPEVVGEAGLIFDLSRPDTLAEKMNECLNHATLSASLTEKGLERAKQYSWQTSAELIWDALNEL